MIQPHPHNEWYRWLPAWIAGYYALQVVVHMATSTSLAFDDAEQVVMGQAFAWGYGPQLPLYTWLFRLINGAIPDPVLVTSLMRNALLATIAIGFWCFAQRITTDRTAAFATLSLILIPQLSWEAQHSHTHTTMAVAACALTFVAVMRLVRTGSVVAAVVVGVMVTLGLLSKYNFAGFFGALVVSCALDRKIRESVSWLHIAIITVIPAVAVTPTMLWTFRNSDLVLARVDGFEMAAGAISGRLNGFIELVLAFFALFGLLFVVYAIVLRLWEREPRPALDEQERAWGLVLWRMIALGFLAVLALIILTGTSNIKPRWLEPMLWFLSLPLAMILASRINHQAMRAMTLVAAGLASLILVLGVAMIALPSVAGTAPKSYPYGELVSRLRAEGLDARTLIISDLPIAGNLKARLPDTIVLTPEYGRLPVSVSEPAVLVWRGLGEQPEGLDRVFRERFGREPVLGEPKTVTVKRSDQRDFSISFRAIE